MKIYNNVRLQQLLKNCEKTGTCNYPKPPELSWQLQEYFHQPKYAVGYTFIERHGTEDIANNVKLTISVDGVFIFKSCNGSLWPILGMLYLFSPFMVALYFRSNEVNEVDEFIHDAWTCI